MDGTNRSDVLGSRPGIKAAREKGFVSPFADLLMDKKDVIQLALDLGLNHNPLESRSCILTRFAYGVPIDFNLVQKIRAAENFLLENRLSGFRFRVSGSRDFILQIDTKQKLLFLQVQAPFDRITQDMDLFPYTVQFIAFDQITGYFDKY